MISIYKTSTIKNKLSHDIDCKPAMLSGTEKNIIDINDQRIVIDKSSNRYIVVIYILGFAASSHWFYDEARGEIIGLIISAILMFLALVSLLWFIFHKKKYVYLERDTGIISIPGPFWYANKEVLFKDVVATIRSENYYYARLNVLNVYRLDGFKVDIGINTMSLDALYHDWAFYCWYMDKSRTLPPSPVFDKYRVNSNSSVAASTD